VDAPFHTFPNPIVTAWRTASHEERAEFLEACEFDIARLRHELSGERIAITANEMHEMQMSEE
jgi:hypothetical protein